MTLLLTGLLLSGCGGSSRAISPEPLPPFPAFPELSDEFYRTAPRLDLDKLLQREGELTAWQKKAKRRLEDCR